MTKYKLSILFILLSSPCFADDKEILHKENCLEDYGSKTAFINNDFSHTGESKVLKTGCVGLSKDGGIVFEGFVYQHPNDIGINGEYLQTLEIKFLDAFYAEAKRRIELQ